MAYRPPDWTHVHWTHVHWEGHATALSPRDGETGWSRKGTLPDSSSLQPALQPAPVMKVPSRKRERSLLNGIRSICPAAELVSLGDVCCAEHQRDAHHRRGGTWHRTSQAIAGN